MSICELICSTLVTSNTVCLKQNALFPKQLPLLTFLICEWHYSLLFFKTLPQIKSWNYLRILYFSELYINISHQELTNSFLQYLLKLSLPFRCHYHHAPSPPDYHRVSNQGPHGRMIPNTNRLASRNWIQYFFLICF